VEVANMSSIWTVSYRQPSRYNWMLQFYLRAEGLALSWIGTGRLIFSLNYTDADFAAVADRFVAPARAMQQDGWWWSDPALTNKTIKRRVLKEMTARRSASRADHPNSKSSLIPATAMPSLVSAIHIFCPASKTWMAVRSPAITAHRRDVQGDRACASARARKLLTFVDRIDAMRPDARVDELAAQQIVRRLVVEFHVMERIGQDLRRPNEACH